MNGESEGRENGTITYVSWDMKLVEADMEDLRQAAQGLFVAAQKASEQLTHFEVSMNPETWKWVDPAP